MPVATTVTEEEIIATETGMGKVDARAIKTTLLIQKLKYYSNPKFATNKN